MKPIVYFLCLVTLFAANFSSAAETWSPALSVKLIFPQAKREDPNHPHSEKIIVSLADMSWLPNECKSQGGYFYIEKTDTHLYSLLMAAMFAKSTVQVAMTNLQNAAGICRVTMIGSPTWN